MGGVGVMAYDCSFSYSKCYTIDGNCYYAMINQSMSVQATVEGLEQVKQMLADASSSECTKAREQLLETYMNCDNFMKVLLFVLLNCPEAASLPTQQHCANMLDRIATMRMHHHPKPIHFHAIFALHFKALLNWTLPHTAKKLFSSSLSESLDYWQEEFDEFWETATETIIDLLELAGKDDPASKHNLSKTIDTTFLTQPAIVTLQEPYDKGEVLLTVIFLMDIFFEKFLFRSEAYKRRGLQMLKRVHRLVFTEDFILQHTPVVHRLLNFLHDFILHVPEDGKLQQVAVALCSWEELPRDMQTVLRVKAVPFQDHPNSFNIFLLSEHWESKAFIDLKTQALDIINDIVFISQGLSEIPEQTLNAISLDYSCNSVYYSLLWLVQQERGPSEEEYLLELSLLTNLSCYMCIFSHDLQQYHQLLASLALPIINYEVEHNFQTYQGRPEDLNSLLNNCILAEQDNDRLPVACHLLETVMDVAGDELMSFIRGYVLSILAERCGKDLPALPLGSEQARSMPVLSVETCFLVLSVLNYKEMSSIEWKALQSMLTEETFRSFSGKEKIYFYCFLCMTYEQIYDASNPCDFVFTYPYEKECPADVEHFALIFFNEIQDYSDCFARKFMENFHKLRDRDLVYMVMMKLMKFVDRINEYSVCRLVTACVAEAKRLTKTLIQKMSSNESYDSRNFRAIREISYCHLFARNHDFVKGKPDLIACLVEAFKTAKIMVQISADDQSVLVGADLLHCVNRFPDGFIDGIPAVIEGFRSSEYNGRPYYQFFANCMELMSKNPFDETIGNLVSCFYDTLAEAYSYFINYPDDILDDQCLNLANIQALLLNFLILFADKLAEDCMRETEKLTVELMGGQYKDEHVMVVRGYNILLLCRIMGSKEYPLQHLHSLLKKSNEFNSKNDAILLIYLLNQIRTQLPIEEHYILISIVLHLLKAADAFKRTRQAHLKERLKQSNAIFQCLTYPIEMSMTELEQANIFLTDYSNDHPDMLQLIVEEMDRHAGEKELLVFLEKAQLFNQNKGIINMGLYDSQEEEKDSQSSEDPKTQPPEDTQRKRKIVKIVGDRDQQGNSQVVYTHLIRKRAMQTPPKTQEEADMARVLKRRKANESLDRMTKRELMMEKRDRRATRI